MNTHHLLRLLVPVLPLALLAGRGEAVPGPELRLVDRESGGTVVHTVLDPGDHPASFDPLLASFARIREAALPTF
jgi:hypothetical protein